MKHSYHKKRRTVFYLLTVTVALMFVVPITRIAGSVIRLFAETAAVNHATKCVNETVDAYLNSLNIHYSDVAQIQADANGEVTAIRIDSTTLNHIKTGVTAKVAEYFSEVQTVDFQIPIGTLCGSNLLAGKGFSIPFSVSYSASCDSELNNLFVTKGINQTQHRIILHICAKVNMLYYGKTRINDIKTQITIAETIIVGNIPEIYAGANDEIWPNLIE